MKKLTIFSFLFLFHISNGQTDEVFAKGYSYFQISFKKDLIDFVVADTTLEQIKPILLFCQGSMPVPLFLDFGSEGIFSVTLNNFDLEKMKEHYHVVVISMPHTPVIVSPDHLNHSYCYVRDTLIEHSYDPNYINGDYLDNYVDRANRVIKFLLKQKWVKKEGTVVAGHSQGARVAVGIAAENKKVNKLGLFGYNPLGRVDQIVWDYRKKAEKGEISWEEADSLQSLQYEFYKEIQNNDSVASNPGLKSWKSFSRSTIDQLTALEIPVFIAFGSNDIVAEYCDLLPLYFIEKGKSNYILKRYPNLEHNFFPVGEDGQIDYSNGQWSIVMNTFVEWSFE